MKYYLGVSLVVLLCWLFYPIANTSTSVLKAKPVIPTEFISFSADKPFIFNSPLPEKGKDWIFGFWLKLPKAFQGKDNKLIFSKFGNTDGIGYGFDSDITSTYPEIAWYKGKLQKYAFADFKFNTEQWYYHCILYSSDGNLGIILIDENGAIKFLGAANLKNILPENKEKFIFPGSNSNVVGSISSPVVLSGKLSRSWLKNCANASENRYDSNLSIIK